MSERSRLNLLVTHESRPDGGARNERPWYETLSHMLSPLGVQMFEATNGPEAVRLIEDRPIHLAVVDTRLSDIGGMNVLRLIQKIRQRAQQSDFAPAAPQSPPQGIKIEMRVEERSEGNAKHRRIEVKFDASPAQAPVSPVVILLTPQPTEKVMHEALAFNAFSVLAEPVDVNLMLEMMARAMKRFHQNQWPH